MVQEIVRTSVVEANDYPMHCRVGRAFDLGKYEGDKLLPEALTAFGAECERIKQLLDGLL